MKKVAILNTSILTAFGSFNYEMINVEKAKELIANGFISAIGHESTANIVSTLLDADVKMNRIQFKQEVNEIALVFKLNGRPEEGKILTVDEIMNIGFSFGKLTRTK